MKLDVERPVDSTGMLCSLASSINISSGCKSLQKMIHGISNSIKRL